jgi:hypothetical protein
MPRDGAVVLSDLRNPALSIVCEPCGRRGAYNVARLMEQHGDAKLTDLLQTLADCPRSPSVHDRCKAGYEGLEERWARARSEDTSMCAARAQPACSGAAGGTFSVQAGSRQAKRSAPAARADRVPGAAMADGQAPAALAQVHPQAGNE